MKNNYRTWIEIDSKAFNHNVAELANLIGPQTGLGIVLKADAYGHGLELMGRLCQENDAVSWLFTAGITEAVRLRASGIVKPILVLAYLDDNLTDLIDYHIACIIADRVSAQKLSDAAVALKTTITVHIKVDTGMSRLGFQQSIFPEALAYLSTLPGITITGIFTHLSDTNNSDYSCTKNQLEAFDTAVLHAEKVLGKKLFKHALSSGALHLAERYDCVRVGTNLYGYWKSPLQEQRVLALRPHTSLIPLLTWKTRICDIKNLKPGDSVGYHRTFIATHHMKIAILPVGYYDGYQRSLSHKARVIVRGSVAPIIGIISMNLMVIDVTLSGSIRIDDEVILCGNSPGLTAPDLATMTDSLQNEFLSRISPHIPRILV